MKMSPRKKTGGRSRLESLSDEGPSCGHRQGRGGGGCTEGAGRLMQKGDPGPRQYSAGLLGHSNCPFAPCGVGAQKALQQNPDHSGSGLQRRRGDRKTPTMTARRGERQAR